ncbi:hypothetical protein DNL40_09650 [Xylanimonas oleitrophica]|uniref:Uncharacterized protein n=1 Tax=Xylanimonas oleitrophica TaxID=2607479 RepID=A0A2W5WPQ3_9MICO|nr:hypothetical protein [Xylanimonas oleitrophica]PZR52912.1 hypothetical protein DNL40_09650 [Xylanimonas oleitrophica]
MGFLDRLLGREPRDRDYGNAPYQSGGYPSQGYSPGKPGYGTTPGQQPAGAPASAPSASTAAGRSADDVAIERYRYLLRTAPPDAVEQAHAEAFARLTPDQRRQVLAELGSTLPPQERGGSDDPQSLARMATRAEMRNPGTLEQTFRGRPGAGSAPGFGSMVGSSLLGTVAGVVIGSAVANMLFGPAFGDPGQDFAGDAGAEDPGADAGGAEAAGADGADAAGDSGGGFFGDLFGGGGDGGGFGGDFGGGDF